MSVRLLIGICVSLSKSAGNDFESALNVVGDITALYGEENNNGCTLHDAVFGIRVV